MYSKLYNCPQLYQINCNNMIQPYYLEDDSITFYNNMISRQHQINCISQKIINNQIYSGMYN
jgi:hypothetical protein